MRKFTQRELLSEGFWDSFKGAAKGAMQVGKEIANVVAPEITEPYKKLVNWKQGATDRINAAANPEKALDKFLNDYSFHRLPNTKIQKLKKPTVEGDVMYAALVSRLHINDEGQPEAELPEDSKRPYGGVFKNPRVIVKLNRDNQFKMVRSPLREMGSFEDKENPPPVKPPPVKPPPTP